MKLPPRDVDPIALAAAVGSQATLEFQPLGEDSYIYSGGGLFVRLQRDCGDSRLEGTLRAVQDLRFPFVLKPLNLFRSGNYLAAVFPFVAGRILGPGELKDAGRCLAELHCAKCEGLSLERFGHPFAPALEAVLTSELLAPDQSMHVRSVAARIKQVGAVLRSESIELVVTHGDPNTHNWLIEADGTLWLCDWGELGLGPRERDLFAFSEPELQDAFAGYGRRPDERILEFYRLRWVLQEVADYGSRLLDPECLDQEHEHARAELAKYLG